MTGDLDFHLGSFLHNSNDAVQFGIAFRFEIRLVKIKEYVVERDRYVLRDISNADVAKAEVTNVDYAIFGDPRQIEILTFGYLVRCLGTDSVHTSTRDTNLVLSGLRIGLSDTGFFTTRKPFIHHLCADGFACLGVYNLTAHRYPHFRFLEDGKFHAIDVSVRFSHTARVVCIFTVGWNVEKQILKR